MDMMINEIMDKIYNIYYQYPGRNCPIFDDVIGKFALPVVSLSCYCLQYTLI